MEVLQQLQEAFFGFFPFHSQSDSMVVARTNELRVANNFTNFFSDHALHFCSLSLIHLIHYSYNVCFTGKMHFNIDAYETTLCCKYMPTFILYYCDLR